MKIILGKIEMFTVLVSLVCIGIIGYAIGKHQISSTEIGHSRQKRCE